MFIQLKNQMSKKNNFHFKINQFRSIRFLLKLNTNLQRKVNFNLLEILKCKLWEMHKCRLLKRWLFKFLKLLRLINSPEKILTSLHTEFKQFWSAIMVEILRRESVVQLIVKVQIIPLVTLASNWYHQGILN